MQNLRKLAVLEVLYKDANNEQFPINPDEVQCTQTPHVVEVPRKCTTAVYELIDNDVMERR